MTAKIWSFDSMPEIFPSQDGLARIIVGGCFDVLHFGHIKFLEAAKALGGVLTVVLESDEKIIKSKNRRPIHTQLQRAEILSHLRFVDEILLLPYSNSSFNSYEEYHSLVMQLKPQFLAVTAGDTQLNNKKAQAHAVGAQLVVVMDAIPTFSSSHLIKEKDWI